MDYYGYPEVEYEIYDRKGYRAKWLESKITPEDHSRIEELIINSREEA